MAKADIKFCKVSGIDSEEFSEQFVTELEKAMNSRSWDEYVVDLKRQKTCSKTQKIDAVPICQAMETEKTGDEHGN